MQLRFKWAALGVALSLCPTLLLAGSPSNLKDLENLRAGIRNIQAIHTHVEVFGRQLLVGSFFEYGAPGTNVCQIMKVDADINTAVQATHTQQLQKLNQLNLSNPTCDTTAGPNKNWSKFTYFTQALVRRIDWYDQASGILVQSAKFDESGFVIVFDRYTNISANLPNPITSYTSSWNRFRKSALIVQHQRSTPDVQVAELEEYCDLETKYNLRAGLAQDLANNHVKLELGTAPPLLPVATATPTPTAISTRVLIATPTSMPTSVPTVTRTPTPLAVHVTPPATPTTVKKEGRSWK